MKKTKAQDIEDVVVMMADVLREVSHILDKHSLGKGDGFGSIDNIKNKISTINGYIKCDYIRRQGVVLHKIEKHHR